MTLNFAEWNLTKIYNKNKYFVKRENPKKDVLDFLPALMQKELVITKYPLFYRIDDISTI